LFESLSPPIGRSRSRNSRMHSKTCHRLPLVPLRSQSHNLEETGIVNRREPHTREPKMVGSTIEAAQARLALYAECVQCEGDEVVLADEHRHLDELALVEVCGEHCPGFIGDASVGV
jgi:hypothetical protein